MSLYTVNFLFVYLKYQSEVHTYAAICIEKLLRVKDKTPQGQVAPRYDPVLETQRQKGSKRQDSLEDSLDFLIFSYIFLRSMKGPLLQMVQPILQIIAANKGISMNEYLMRSASIFHHFIPFHSISQDCGEDIRLPEAAGIDNTPS